MTALGKRLTRKQEVAIGAMLTERTVEDAARKVGVTDRTLNRWCKLPEFQAAFQAARRKALESAIARLQALTGKAVAALERLVDSDSEQVSLAASRTVLETTFKSTELIDLAERLQAIEERLDAAAKASTGQANGVPVGRNGGTR